MTPKSVLVKRSIEKDGLPKDGGVCIVIDTGELIIVEFDDENKLFIDDSLDEVKPQFYYEELPLSQIIQEVMPTEDEIGKAFPYNKDYRMDSPVNDRPAYIRQGIEWFKDQLTK